jgi:DNA (cytosine-5)-methyltransferase 1
MLTPQHPLDLSDEIVVDLFAGGGGASTGIEQALGYPPHIAINHDPEAVALHQANHPQTRHFVSDVFEVDPVAVTEGRPVGLLWASPDCKHFSKAKGGKPVSKKIRSLAWVVVKWAKAVRPRVILLENVEEFQTWGPLGADSRPCPLRKGRTFRRWKRSLEQLGYTVEHRELRACDYGAPTIRKRLFLVARRDGAPIVWPDPTHAAPGSLLLRARKAKPWRTAADCIDWSIACPSIFERTRELADATKRRIAKGVMRYVVEAKEPFIGADGRALTKTAQVRMCGNSVCPPLARAIVAANYAEPQVMREAA